VRITGEYKATRDGRTYCYAGTWQSLKHSLDWDAKVHLDTALVAEPYGAIGGVPTECDASVHVKRMIEDVIESHIAVR
jgi:hypothetical protein